MLLGITEHLKDLGHLPSGPQVHAEARHGTARGQSDYTAVKNEGGKKGLVVSVINVSLWVRMHIWGFQCASVLFQLTKTMQKCEKAEIKYNINIVQFYII